MRTAAALCLVAIVLSGGVIAGVVAVDGGGGPVSSWADDSESGSDAGAADGSTAEASGGQTYRSTPEENLQDDSDDDSNDSDDPDEEDDDETPTPTETPTETATVVPPPSSSDESEFEVVDATLGSNATRVGEYVSVTALVENRGDRNGTYEAELLVDGEVVATEPVFVPANDVETVEFQIQFEEPGEYGLAVGDVGAGTLTVEPRESDATGEVEVIDAVVPADVVREGVRTTARATVENPNDDPVNATLVVTVDGDPVAEAEVALDAGERTEVTIPFEAREGAVAVNGVEAGQLQVSESVGGNGGGDEDPDERAGLEFGVLAATVVIVGALLVAATVQWRSDESMLSEFEERRR